MAERSNAAVLKTVDCNRSGGSNPSLSAETQNQSTQFIELCAFLIFMAFQNAFISSGKWQEVITTRAIGIAELYFGTPTHIPGLTVFLQQLTIILF